MSYQTTINVTTFAAYLLVATVIASPSQAAVTYSLTPASIIKQINGRGATPIVRELYSDGKAWSKILTAIASGKEPWIDVAVALRKGSDAGSTSMLRDSVFEALKENPNYVLLKATKAFRIGRICSGRADPLPTYKAASIEVDRTIKAVHRIDDKNLENLKGQCLKHLEGSQKNLRRFFGVNN